MEKTIVRIEQSWLDNASPSSEFLWGFFLKTFQRPILFLCVYLWEYMLCICVFLQRPGESVRLHGNGVTEHCKSPTVGAGNWPTGPSLQLFFLFKKNSYWLLGVLTNNHDKKSWGKKTISCLKSHKIKATLHSLNAYSLKTFYMLVIKALRFNINVCHHGACV